MCVCYVWCMCLCGMYVCMCIICACMVYMYMCGVYVCVCVKGLRSLWVMLPLKWWPWVLKETRLSKPYRTNQWASPLHGFWQFLLCHHHNICPMPVSHRVDQLIGSQLSWSQLPVSLGVYVGPVCVHVWCLYVCMCGVYMHVWCVYACVMCVCVVCMGG